ncbi:VCBS repeat-containing protein [Streptomyces sp. WZ-12]|uniref:VCBS repeat-containing protein n=1 Tax=Streptomyces sp. WZ-12 TaxID=3030210 RepID=UPI0023815859|nr:VCBS repeat-containing protein [Streptomyces sp. WZ-12]
MALSSCRKAGRTLARFATAALAVALVGTTAGTATADDFGAARAAAKGTKPATSQQAPGAAPYRSTAVGQAPIFPLFTVNRSGDLFVYQPDFRGGLEDREVLSRGEWKDFTAATQVDHDQDGDKDGVYTRVKDGSLLFVNQYGGVKRIGGGWNIYDRIMSPGNLAGQKQSDILARDKSGVLWMYMAYEDGTLTGRYKVGGGWGQYTDIAGVGDLDGDGYTDIVAKDRAGVLWLYKGNGRVGDGFQDRTRIGGGWNAYDHLVSVGDLDRDGRSDLLARDKTGALWLYKGNGNGKDPFDRRVKIGNRGWDQYRLMF